MVWHVTISSAYNMSTEKQFEANRENAKLSTGPRTAEGKSKSSFNAVKTGLTGRTVLLSGDDATVYQEQVQRFIDQYRPEGEEERTLVQSIADTEWRLLRIPSLEAGIYALGRLEFASLFDHDDPAVCAALIEAKTFLAYQKQINNLGVQETRLRRQLENDRERLKQIQNTRAKAEQKKAFDQMHASIAAKDNQLMRAALKYKECARNQQSFDPEEFGFEFSKEEIEDYGFKMGGPYTAFFSQIRRNRAA